MKKEILNEQFNQCHSGHPTHVILNLIQDLNRDAECPQHDGLGSESGRSMVEMLGVLAVMGLLTIIGIAGFKIAMNKAKANNLVADMNRLAHVVSMDKFSGYSAEAIERDVTEHNQGTEHFVSCNSTFKSTMFSLTLDNPIDKEMCEQLANLDWQVPQGVFLNEVEKSDFTAEDCADSNTLTWVFMDDLSHCSDCVLADTKCDTYGTNGQLECGSCSDLKGYERDDSKCANSAKGQYCILGNCSPCDTGETLYNNNCKACSEINNDNRISADDCHRCVDAQGKYTHFMRSGAYCFKCSDDWSSAFYGTSLADCNLCENRCLRRDQSYCGEPGKIYEYGISFVGYALDPNGDGHCKCADGYLPNNQGACLACDQINDTIMSADNCHKCVDAENKYTHFMRQDMYCFKCSDTGSSTHTWSSLAECRLCENRCLASNGVCYVYGPGETYTGKDAEGYCTRVSP